MAQGIVLALSRATRVTVAIRCRTYEQLTSAFAARRRELGLRQLDADEKAGLQSSYVGKLEIGTRKLGPLSLPMLLAAYDLDILLVPRSDVAPVEHRGLSGDKADRFTHHPTGDLANDIEDTSPRRSWRSGPWHEGQRRAQGRPCPQARGHRPQLRG
jgi:transcriptional regulator with XRE-family HTH domain